MTDPVFTLNKVWNGTTLIYDKNLVCTTVNNERAPQSTFSIIQQGNYLSIDNPEASHAKLTIHSIDGRYLLENFLQIGLKTIQIPAASPGVYLVTIHSEHQILYSRKIILY